MAQTIIDLDPEETYYAYPFMTYKFQTSNEYPVLGERIEFITGVICATLTTPEITSSFEGSTICSETIFDYTITTSIPVDEILWTRNAHPDINNNEAGTGNTAFIHEQLHNTGSSEVTVTYLMTVFTQDCKYENIGAISVTVMPEIDMQINRRFSACINDKVLNIKYRIGIKSAEYKLTFSEEGLKAGFVNMEEYMPLPESNIALRMPKEIGEGKYPATLSIRIGNCEKEYDITLQIIASPQIIAISDKEINLRKHEELDLFVEAEGEVQYQWYLEDEPIDGATNFYYSNKLDISIDGNISVSISNECATQRVDFKVHQIMGTEDIETFDQYKLTVYPNPTARGANFILSLELPKNETPDAAVRILDATGKQVDEFMITKYETVTKLNVAEGTYFIRVSTKSGKELITKIMVKQ
jgi:hypothetical protein